MHGARSDLSSHLLQLPSKRNLWGHSEFQIKKNLEATNSAGLQLSWNLRAIYCKQKQEPQVVTSHCLVLKSLWTVSVLSFSYVFGCSDLLMGSPSPLPALCLVLLSLLLFLPGFIHSSSRGCWPFSQDVSFPQTRRIVSGKLMALKQSLALFWSKVV